MKLRKFLLSFLIILASSMGLLFGCTVKPLKLSVYFNEEVVESLNLKLPISSAEEPETPEEPTEPEIPTDPVEPEVPVEPSEPVEPGEPSEPEEDEIVLTEKAQISIIAENPNKMFENGLDVIVSKNNIVRVDLIETKEDSYVYEIIALYPDSVVITFKTKDEKVQTTLNVNVLQDIEKIEANIKSENYVILGQDKEINANVIKFTPSTTTDKNIIFSLAQEYQGITIVNNKFIFDEDIAEITLNGEKVDKIYVNCKHNNYEEGIDDNTNYIVENIEFDILSPIGSIAAIVPNSSTEKANFEFATNSTEDRLNFAEIVIKQKISKGTTVTFEDLDSTYEIKYYLKDNTIDIVNIERSINEKNLLTISQKYKDGTNALVIYAQNKYYPSYKSNEIEIPINIKTYPTYFNINGLRQPEEVILYDNGKAVELDISVGTANSFDTRYKVTGLNTEFLSLKYANGQDVSLGNPVNSGNKLYLSFLNDSATSIPDNSLISFYLESVGNSELTVTITCRIVKSLNNVNVTHKNQTGLNFEISKVDNFGNVNEAIFTLTNSENIFIPNYSLEVINENIVTVSNINYNSKTFTLKTLTVGETLVKIKFDNGYEKEINILVYMPVDSFKIDVDEITKNNHLGQIIYESNNIKSLAIKINEHAKLIIKAYDNKNALILDKNIFTVNYQLEDKYKEFIVISNVDNTISALKETTEPVPVKAIINAINSQGNYVEHEIIFNVSVYIPIKTITLSETYVQLYTENSLGYRDKHLSTVDIEVLINPFNATMIDYTKASGNNTNSIRSQENFVTNVDLQTELNIDKLNENKYILKVSAIDLDNLITTTGTITFTIHEFDIIYTRKVTIKITKPQAPETILLDNIKKLSDGNEEIDYLYFNLGYSSEVEVNPRVYPLNSYNSNYQFEIVNSTVESDPIIFDKSTGIITPITAGECEIVFIPNGSFTSETDYNEDKARKIKIFVADGEGIPYQIANKEDFLKLCSKEIVVDKVNHDKIYSKNYILTNDIDLSGAEILPIGIYLTKQGALTEYNKTNFTGSFSGKFTIGNLSRNYTISGLSIKSNYGDAKQINGIKNEYYLGLFAQNEGNINFLNIYYTNIDIISSAAPNESTSISNNNTNLSYSFYFGGIAGVNNNLISNCNVTIYSSNITTYMKDNYVGVISGKNDTISSKRAIIENCKVDGNLNIVDGVSKYYLDNETNNNSSTLKILAGGFVGENSGYILDDFNIYDNSNEIFNKDKIASTLTLTSVQQNELLYLNSSSAFGLIAGLNTGNIGNSDTSIGLIGGLSSYGKIIAYNNIGGIAGINNGNIENSFSASTLKGVQNVGGLIGSQTGVNGTISNNAVVFLDDGTNKVKIEGQNYVAGLIGNDNGNFSSLVNNIKRNFVNSYVANSEYDVLASETNFGAIYSGSSNGQNGTNIANFKLKHANDILTFSGVENGVGIIAPTSINVNINSTTLTNNSLGYNKFIKADENTIILYYYNNSDYSNYNKYLQNYIFSIDYDYPSGEDYQQLSLTQLESLNKDVLDIDINGVITVKKAGTAKIHIYSLLNKNAKSLITVKVVNYIDAINFYTDSLYKNSINSYLQIKKDTSLNLYLNESIKQDDIYLKYTLSSGSIEINDGSNNYFKTLNAQVIKALNSGTTKVDVEVFVKIDDEFIKIDYLTYSFNVIVSVGLENAFVNATEGTLVANSSMDFSLDIVTDLSAYTSIIVEQKVDEVIGEYLNVVLEKNIENTNLVYNFKISPNKNQVLDLINKTVEFKIYIYDSFVSLDLIKSDEIKYSKYIKTLNIKIEINSLMSVDLAYFADGEIMKDENGNDIINITELESEYIKIGKIGILKINAYPIQNLTSLVLSYTNSDNYNLNFKQVKKGINGYEDVNTASINGNTIVLDIDKNNIDGSYIYVKLLTDSPINENSIFKLRLVVNNEPYYYEKNLTSKLATNIDISYDNAILNTNGVLEGVYAKGVQDEQIITLTVSKLNNYIPRPIQNNNTVNIVLLSRTVVSEDVTIYKYIIQNLIKNAENFEVYFYIDKMVNGKVERYISSTLKLNVVDFVVNSISVENVQNNYLTKPFGCGYDLKVKLNTTNNKSVEVLNKISELEDRISKSANWYIDNDKLLMSDYNDFIVTNNNGYYNINPKTIFKGYNLSTKFKIIYKYNEGNFVVDFNEINNQIATNIYFENGNYIRNFSQSFGLNFYLQTDINNPVPIYSQDDFVDMQQGANYILLNDIVLENYAIQKANFNSLDGNGYKVIIKSFDIDLTQIQSELNFGLFDEVTENSLIKNLTVEFDLDINGDFVTNTNGNTILNLINIEKLNFGALAGKNNGLIYNCQANKFVEDDESVLNINLSNILNDSQTTAYIGGLVGRNNGIITNSRSELKLRTNKGFLAGFVAENNGTIASSYYKNALITNLGEDENTSTTAGFVNINNGNIKFSYVEGEQNRLVDGIYLANSLLSDDYSDYCLTASTSIGGFVYNNFGQIEDCYANLSLTSQSFSGGFVFANSGKILRSYSATKNQEENSEAHAPFISIKEQFNVNEMKKLIIDCFYLNINKSTINDNLVTGLSLNEFNNEYYLTNFVIEDTGIWSLRGNATPTLISANEIAVSQRRLYNTHVDGSGSTIYNYIYSSYYSGHKNNPIIITNEVEFLNYFTLDSGMNDYYYRLVNNINFSQYSNLPTSDYIFSGRLDGNGLTISGVSISAQSSFDKNAFGLFGEIIKSGDIRPVVKNLNIEPLEVYANNVQKVGTLAGRIQNADIINININAEGIIVQGKNIVGGVVGEVLGDSKLINIASNISANANYVDDISHKTRIYNQTKEDDNNKLISYAGGICGVVNTSENIDDNENIRNIIVNNGVKIIGQFTGFAFGLICENSGVDNVKVYVDNKGYLNSTYAAGMVIGENRGYISRVETLYAKTEDQMLSVFKNETHVIGGIIGFNNNGTIVNSIARVSTIASNVNTKIAGGVIGLSVGGSVSSVIAVNNVYSNLKIGGIIGQASRRDDLCEPINANETNAINDKYEIFLKEDDTQNLDNNDNAIKTNNIIYIANTVALNPFGNESLKEDKIIGAIFGAIHNTITSESGNVSLTLKNSYIVENNYYLEKVHYTKVTTDEGTGNEIKSTQMLLDFGASQCGYYADEQNAYINKGDVIIEKMIATPVNNSSSINVFSRFSSNVFDNLAFATIENIPTLKAKNNINTKTLEGEGTFANPYQVNSVKALNQLAEFVKSGNNKVYVNLTDNIEATGKIINSIGDDLFAFNGTFNGNNYFINGLTYFNNANKYETSNYFGLFSVVGTSGVINNLNIVANFVINYGQSVTYTGIVSGINHGYISNVNVYGGIVAVLQNISSNALSYIGGIAGVNDGNSSTRILSCSNNAIIYITVVDVENLNNNTALNNINIYAGFIAGANLNKAIINRCSNNKISNYNVNGGSKDYTLIVINSSNNNSQNCNNHVGHTVGYYDSTSTAYELTYNASIDKNNLIYSKAKNNIYSVGK